MECLLGRDTAEVEVEVERVELDQGDQGRARCETTSCKLQTSLA